MAATSPEALQRRGFLSLTGAAALSAVLAPGEVAGAAAGSGLFYASTGAQVCAYAVRRPGRLARVAGPFAVAEAVQSGWYAARHGILYLASSDESTRRQGRHVLEAFRVGPGGDLLRWGAPVALDSRPIDITADAAGDYLLVAHNRPATASVFALTATGAVGPRIAQPTPLDLGIYPHQIRLFPREGSVLAPARGNDASPSGAEDPGSLQVLGFRAGALSPLQRLSPGQGLNYRPRHAVFHPSGRWLYVDLESQNQLQMHEVLAGGTLGPARFTASTLSQPARPGQLAAAVVMHPSGRTLYVANRGTGTEVVGGAPVAVGENSVAVFRLDPRSGKPVRVQNAAIPGVHPRTLALSPDGRWLVAATILPARVRRGARVETREAGLTLFQVRGDGGLAYRATLDLDTTAGSLFWVGSLAPPHAGVGPA